MLESYRSTCGAVVLCMIAMGAGCSNQTPQEREDGDQVLDSGNCATEEFFDVRRGQCVPARSSEDTYQGYLYERLAGEAATIRDAASSASGTEYLISLTSWHSPSSAASLLEDPAIDSIREVRFLFPNVMSGTRMSVRGLEGSARSAMPTAVEQAYAELNDSFPDLSEVLQESKRNQDVRIAIVTVIADAEDILGFWNRNPDSVRFVQIIRTDADKLQNPFEPEREVR